jgi:hypothetical protein
MHHTTHNRHVPAAQDRLPWKNPRLIWLGAALLFAVIVLTNGSKDADIREAAHLEAQGVRVKAEQLLKGPDLDSGANSTTP